MGNVCSDCCKGLLKLGNPLPLLLTLAGRSRDGLYDNALAESEREAVADLLNYLENVRSFNALAFPYKILAKRGRP